MAEAASPKGLLGAISIPGALKRFLSNGDVPPVAEEVVEVEVPPLVPPTSSPPVAIDGRGGDKGVSASPTSSPMRSGRKVLGSHRRLPTLDAANRNFVLERLRHEVVKMLVMRESATGGVSYLPDDVLQNFALSDEQGLVQLIADELAASLRPTETEKPYDTVLSSGEYGAIFGAGLAQALMRSNPSFGRVIQRFITTSVVGEDLKSPFRVTRGTAEDRLVISNRRVVLAVPVITPENWEVVSDQYAHLRGSAENTNAVAVVAILRIGKPPEGIRSGLRMESFATYY